MLIRLFTWQNNSVPECDFVDVEAFGSSVHYITVDLQIFIFDDAVRSQKFVDTEEETGKRFCCWSVRVNYFEITVFLKSESNKTNFTD